MQIATDKAWFLNINMSKITSTKIIVLLKLRIKYRMKTPIWKFPAFNPFEENQLIQV